MAPPLQLDQTGVSASLIYLTGILYILSHSLFSVSLSTSTNILLQTILSCFLFRSFVQLSVSLLLVYLLRINEIVYGSYRYASIVLTIIVINLPLKFLMYHSGFRVDGPLYLLSSLVVLYYRSIPTVRSDAAPISSSYFISMKLCILLLLLVSSLFGGFPSLVEVVVSGTISYFLCPSRENPKPLLSCPRFIVDAIHSIWKTPEVHQVHERVEYNGQEGNYETDVVADEEMVEQLMLMGFEREACIEALKKTLNDVTAAANLLLG